jgi:hypothetical protein
MTYFFGGLILNLIEEGESENFLVRVWKTILLSGLGIFVHGIWDKCHRVFFL